MAMSSFRQISGFSQELPLIRYILVCRNIADDLHAQSEDPSIHSRDPWTWIVSTKADLRWVSIQRCQPLMDRGWQFPAFLNVYPCGPL